MRLALANVAGSTGTLPPPTMSFAKSWRRRKNNAVTSSLGTRVTTSCALFLSLHYTMSDPRYRSYQQTVKDSTTREYQNKSTIDSLRAKIRNMRSECVRSLPRSSSLLTIRRAVIRTRREPSRRPSRV